MRDFETDLALSSIRGLRCVPFAPMPWLDAVASNYAVGLTSRCTVLNNVVAEPRNFTTTDFARFERHENTRLCETYWRETMGEPEVHGLQSRWRGTEIIVAARVYNFRGPGLGVTAASRLTGSPQQHWKTIVVTCHCISEKGKRARRTLSLQKAAIEWAWNKTDTVASGVCQNAARKELRCTFYIVRCERGACVY